MSSRPAIYVSAVNPDLRSARELVAETLKLLGYEPQWQDISEATEDDVRAVLRQRIDACKGVVQLVGESFGPEPPTVDEQFGRISYAQYEALYAVSKGKKVWYLLLDKAFPADAHGAEAEDKRKVQSDYRARVQAADHLYHPLTSAAGLEVSVLKLRDDLTQLRRGVKRWAVLVAVLLAASVGLTIWLLQSQHRSNQQLEVLQQKLDKLQRGVNSFAETQNKVRQAQPSQKREEIEQRTYLELSQGLGIDVVQLKEELPRFAAELRKAPNATVYDRANAAYVAMDYADAERLALAAADYALGSDPPNTAQAVKAFKLAGWSAEKRVEYAEALKHLRQAEKLTDRTRDSMEWAGVQFDIARTLIAQSQDGKAEQLLREVLKERYRVLGPEHFDTVAARNSLALALADQGKFGEAETEYRTVLELRERLLGPENRDTIATRNNLGNLLDTDGKYVEAEIEYRAVIKVKEKTLGPEHPATLGTRHNLAFALEHQARYAEAETEFRAVLKLREKVLGPEHAATLETRCCAANVLLEEGQYGQSELEYRAVIELQNKALGPEHSDTLETRADLAEALDLLGRYSEAETEFRNVLRLEGKVFGRDNPDNLSMRSGLAKVLAEEGKLTEAETEERANLILEQQDLGAQHPYTLTTHNDLAGVLDREGKYVEAENEYQVALTLREKVLGPEHPQTLLSRNGLAVVLDHQGRYTEAESEHRAVLRLQQKVLGDEHPDTLRTCFDLATCLRTESKSQEASGFAQRAAEGAKKVLTSEHPDTKRYEKLREELLVATTPAQDKGEGER